jgi:hypothetical protein
MKKAATKRPSTVKTKKPASPKRPAARKHADTTLRVQAQTLRELVSLEKIKQEFLHNNVTGAAELEQLLVDRSEDDFEEFSVRRILRLTREKPAIARPRFCKCFWIVNLDGEFQVVAIEAPPAFLQATSSDSPYTVPLVTDTNLGDPDAGERLLRYVAGVGADAKPRPDFPGSPDDCVGVPVGDDCGNYFFAPSGAQLVQIFEEIASRIFTRLTQ